MYINSKNLVLSIILFISFFLLPNILIYFYSKNESIIIINEISNIVQSVILSLSVDMTLYDSLKNSINVVSYSRFKEEYTRFIDNYIMYNFNLLKAIEVFSKKFKSYEFDMFLSLLSQGEKEGNLIEILETFSDTLEMTYFKNLKFNSSKKAVIIVALTAFLLINCFAIVLYPIVIEISESFTKMFN